MPFNPELDIVTADASPYGICGLLSHRLPDETERPVAFVSRILTIYEAKYSQIEQKSIGVGFSFVVKKFHIFLYRKHFLLATNHRPLTFLLGPHTNIPTLAAARLQRWSLILSAYSYELTYHKGSDMSQAYDLSRLKCDHVKPGPENNVAFFSPSNELPITHREINLATRKESVLSNVLDFTLHGSPNQVDEPLKPHFVRKTEMSVEQICLLWGRRVVVP